MSAFHRPDHPAPARLQRGIAALELALLVLFVMLPVFLGLAIYWQVLQTQQVLTRATGDGARQVSRMLNSPYQPMPDGSRPNEAELRARAATLARDSIRATLRHHLGAGAEVDSRLNVALQAVGSDHWALEATYARPALLGRAAGMNFVEPETLRARSLISADSAKDPT